MDKKRRSARLEPVVAELHAVKGVQKAERIVYAGSARLEVIAVIHLAEALAYSVIVRALFGGKTVQRLLEIFMYLCLRYAADVDITLVHGNVLQVVEVAEHAHLAELCHAREQGEADIAVLCLQH